MRVYARRPRARATLHPLYMYIYIYWGVGLRGYAVESMLLCHEDNQLINRLEGAVKTAFHVPY